MSDGRLPEAGAFSENFDDLFARLQGHDGRRQHTLEGTDQLCPCAVADPNPQHLRPLGSPGGQLEEVLVLGDHDGAAGFGKGPDLTVRRRKQSDIGDVPGFMPGLLKPASQGGGQLGVDEEPHGSGAAQDRVIGLPGGKLKCGYEVSRFEVRIILQDRLVRVSRCQHLEDVAYADPQPPQAWPAAADLGVHGDPVKLGRRLVHTRRVRPRAGGFPPRKRRCRRLELGTEVRR
jgi:hypothetical protein